MKNVLEWLEATVEKYPDKPAFSDTECSITFAQVYDIARNTGAYLIEQLGVDRTPVAVFAGRKMVTPAYFLGVVYAGRPYAPIDASLPDMMSGRYLSAAGSVPFSRRRSASRSRFF